MSATAELRATNVVSLGRLRASEQDPLIGVREAARKLGFSEMSIRRRIEVEDFPAVRMGSRTMVPRAFVDWILGQVAVGRTIVVDRQAINEWSASIADEQRSAGPGGIAARRSDAPAEVPVTIQGLPAEFRPVSLGGV
jgi:hypothetical protein